MEASRTNVILRSQELDNATWTLAGIGGGTAPTVTANAATAPDGTVTADRIDFPAVGAGQTSAIYQTVGGTPYSFSFYVRGVSSGGTLDVCVTGGTCPDTCTYVAGSWTRCVSVLASTINPFFSNYNGRAAQSVYVWGVQAESYASYATSYIPTTSATVTRSAETASFSVSIAGPVSCIGSSINTIYGTPPANYESSALVGATPVGAFYSGGWRYRNATNTPTPTLTPHTALARLVAETTSATTANICLNGTCQATTAIASPTVNFTGLSVGYGTWVGVPNDAINSRIIADPDPSRCR